MENKQDRFLEKLKKVFPDSFELVVTNLQFPKPTVFRVNTLKASESEVLDSLSQQGYDVARAPLPNSFYLVKSSKKLSESPLFTEGKIYIQSLSSMLPALELDLKPGDQLLDMCAAPGSKTSQIAQVTSNQTNITAVENNRNRFFALKNNLELQGVQNVTLLMENAVFLDKKYPQFLEFFDKVLLDAPCSNEGNICLSLPKSLEMWNPKSAKRLSKLQKGLLSTGIKLLKKGGTLVYSTCTFSVEENEEVVSWALKKFPEVRLVKQDRIIPDQLRSGFFVAKLIKPV